ncbi:had family hydrolase [Plasmopara halstedii]|uniref:Had family hydrolase n=1 Tax=Plasmopara halstedii TaxID=4781 RepID=A0A0P1AMQ5_PLAHL|nr:had family hydrolase [Plasmopara halstedii]CEG41953.1 had family hydrolase [Plasmopara halstedii]|eukprot:XP_024578322.1 had family hydrolase [Plasmopara halstedii]
MGSTFLVVRGVTFDLDDTLWCGKTVIRNATAAFHSYLEREVPQLAKKFPPAAFDALLVQFQRTLPDQAHDYTFLRKYTLRHCLHACGAQTLCLQNQTQLEAFIDSAFQAFLVPRSQPELFDGVENLFQGLKSEIRRSSDIDDTTFPILGVITNGNCDMEKLPKYFHHHVDFMISAELVGCAKPEQAIFDAAVNKFPASYQRQHLVHVGDHYECDVKGAKRAGFRTIWVNVTWTKPDVLTRADFSEDDAERYPAADAIVKNVNTVLIVVEHWNSLAKN